MSSPRRRAIERWTRVEGQEQSPEIAAALLVAEGMEDLKDALDTFKSSKNEGPPPGNPNGVDLVWKTLLTLLTAGVIGLTATVIRQGNMLSSMESSHFTSEAAAEMERRITNRPNPTQQFVNYVNGLERRIEVLENRMRVGQ